MLFIKTDVTAAVSVLNLVLPKVIGLIFLFTANSISSFEKSPSGPIIIVVLLVFLAYDI